MPKVYFTLFICLSVFTAQAQLQKGSLLIGLEAGLLTNSNKTGGVEIKNHSLNTSFTIGKAIRDRNFLGVFLELNDSRNRRYTSQLDEDQKTLIFRPGAFYRQYHTIANRLYAFTELRAGVSLGKMTSESFVMPSKTRSTISGAFANFRPGISFRVLKKLYTDVSLPNLFRLEYVVTKQRNDANVVFATSKSWDFGASEKGSAGWLQIGFRMNL